jgi:hypothetical protein
LNTINGLNYWWYWWYCWPSLSIFKLLWFLNFILELIEAANNMHDSGFYNGIEVLFDQYIDQKMFNLLTRNYMAFSWRKKRTETSLILRSVT